MEILKNLLQVKKIIALMLTIVFCILSIIGIVTGEQFVIIFVTVISYYFGQSATRQAISENKQ
ncbi:MAG: hypothetical protein ACI8WT_004780 [Clostridium sp.]|jgi:hypothetical protein